jgi:predicted RNase H-like nuclease (RuvC/YqgF family)
MKEKTLLTLLLIIGLSFTAVAETDKDSSSLTCQECKIQNQELRDNITSLKSNISQLQERVEYYQNQSNYYRKRSQYYRQQYLSSDSDLTNRRVKEIYDNITRIKQEIDYNQKNIMTLEQKFNKIVTKKIFYIGIALGGIFGGLIGSIITFEITAVELLTKIKSKVPYVRKSGNREGESSSNQ